MRVLFILVCVCALLLAPVGCDREVRKRVAFIFCDVTNSLNKSESETVASITARVLNSLPPGTEYRIFPIQAATTRLAAINEDERVIPPKEEDEILQAERGKKRQEALAVKLANLYRVTNTSRNDNRTCILNAIAFAGHQFRDFAADKFDHELIIVSDMLEECDDTPLRQQVDIRKGDITKEIELAGTFPEDFDLSHATINIITPATEETYVKYEAGTRPPMSQLREFWGIVFSRCHVSPEFQKRPEKYFWSNGILPRRFDS
jgi:hypothetical protein